MVAGALLLCRMAFAYELMLEFTLGSEHKIIARDAPYDVVGGPIRNIFRHVRTVERQKPHEEIYDRRLYVHRPELVQGKPRARFQIEDRLILYGDSRRIDMEIAITNAGRSPRMVPPNLRILSGEMAIC